MYRPRVIPLLLLKNDHLVKTRQFSDLDYIGDPLNAVSLFSAFKADELIFLDIDASQQRRSISPELVTRIGTEASMPFSVGGGLRTLEAIRQVLAAGADRVILGTSTLERPDFLRQAAAEFGSSTIALCLDIKSGPDGLPKAYFRHTGALLPEPAQLATRAQALGAGEIIVQSVDGDGMMKGYDIKLIQQISAAVEIPVVALGGAAHYNDLQEISKTASISGAAAGSLFIYQGPKRGVLINYPSHKVLSRLFRPEANA